MARNPPQPDRRQQAPWPLVAARAAGWHWCGIGSIRGKERAGRSKNVQASEAAAVGTARLSLAFSKDDKTWLEPVVIAHTALAEGFLSHLFEPPGKLWVCTRFSYQGLR